MHQWVGGKRPLALVDRRIAPQAQGAKVRAQGAKVMTEGAEELRSRDQQQRLWWYPSINSASTPLAHMVVVTHYQLALVAFFLQPLAQTVLAPWWCHLLQLVMVVFFLPPTGAHTPLELEQLVALCGGGL